MRDRGPDGALTHEEAEGHNPQEPLQEDAEAVHQGPVLAAAVVQPGPHRGGGGGSAAIPPGVQLGRDSHRAVGGKGAPHGPLSAERGRCAHGGREARRKPGALICSAALPGQGGGVPRASQHRRHVTYFQSGLARGRFWGVAKESRLSASAAFRLVKWRKAGRAVEVKRLLVFALRCWCRRRAGLRRWPCFSACVPSVPNGFSSEQTFVWLRASATGEKTDS